MLYRKVCTFFSKESLEFLFFSLISAQSDLRTSAVLFTLNRMVFSSSISFKSSNFRCCPSKGSLTARVISAASLSLSNISDLLLLTGSTTYQRFPSLVSYSYQKRSDFFIQCGLTLVEKIIFFSFSGEKRDANS